MPFSIQVQLKRLADLLVAVALLLITVPFIGLASFYLAEDRGPVLYSQQRSGWVDLSLFISCEQCASSPH